MQRNLKMESAARSASQQAKLEGDTLYEVAPLNDNQTVGRVDQNEESKSDQLSAKKGATTREDAVELKRSLALPSTLAKSVEPRNGTAAFPEVANKRLELGSGAGAAPSPAPARLA